MLSTGAWETLLFIRKRCTFTHKLYVIYYKYAFTIEPVWPDSWTQIFRKYVQNIRIILKDDPVGLINNKSAPWNYKKKIKIVNNMLVIYKKENCYVIISF